MGRLHIDELAEGMTLAHDIHDRSGRLLLGAGTDLSDKHLRMLRTWGITEADIEGVDEKDSAHVLRDEFDPLHQSAVEKELYLLFRNVDLSHPAMYELFRLCHLRKMQHARN